jgi:hypothetical protein
MRHGRVRERWAPTPTTSLYETQARYASGEPWHTLDLSMWRHVALDEALFYHDPWGRTPIELRIRTVPRQQLRDKLGS